MRWAVPGLDRDPLVLFPTRLDDVVSAVRLLDGILGSLDSIGRRGRKDIRTWTAVGRRISPRLLASIILYGLLVQIWASRKLERALSVRLDFRWLAEDMSVDHTTLCTFRRDHADALGDLFVTRHRPSLPETPTNPQIQLKQQTLTVAARLVLDPQRVCFRICRVGNCAEIK